MDPNYLLSRITAARPELTMKWTKEHPTESGFYWYRDGKYIDVVEWDVEMEWIGFCGSDMFAAAFMGNKIVGEFWPVKLEPPP